MRLDINYKKKTVRNTNTNTWRLNNTFLTNQQDTEEIKRGNKKTYRNKWQWKYKYSKPMGCGKSSPKSEVHSNTILHQETRKTLNSNLTLHIKQLEKEEQKNPKLVEGKKS